MPRFAVVLLLVLAIAGCVPQQAILQCQENVALNRAHEADEALPKEARLVAQDNGDAWEVQLYLLDGTEPSQATRDRRAARGGP